MYNRKDVIKYATDVIEHEFFDECYINNNLTDKDIALGINGAIDIIEMEISNTYYYISDIPKSVKTNINNLKQLKTKNLIIDIRKEINKNKRLRKLRSDNWKSDTKFEKKCPKCGDIMTRGSGYFETDFQCQICGAEYDSNLNRLAPRRQWGKETGENFY